MEEMKIVPEDKDINSDLRVVEEEQRIDYFLCKCPQQDVPLGDSDKDNIEIRR